MNQRIRPLLLKGILIGIFAIGCVVIRSSDSPNSNGRTTLLSATNPELTSEVPGSTTTLAEIKSECEKDSYRIESDRTKIVGARIGSRIVYVCYTISRQGTVFPGRAYDGDGFPISIYQEDQFFIANGATGVYGQSSSQNLANGDLVIVGVAMAVLMFVGPQLVSIISRIGKSARQGKSSSVSLLIIAGVLVVLPTWSFGAYVYRQSVSATNRGDTLRIWVMGSLVVAFLFGIIGPLWSARAIVAEAAAPSQAPRGGRKTKKAGSGNSKSDEPTDAEAPTPSNNVPTIGQSGDNATSISLFMQPPSELPTFKDIGGMDDLKSEIKESLGLLLSFSDKAKQYKISWNGILVYGPPGVGKSFIAKAIAGEFGLNFIPVTSADLISSYSGQSAKNVAAAFEFAAENVPCLLFFDEFDSVGQSRDNYPNQESRRVVNQLLQLLERYHSKRELVVMAATNNIDTLDDAVIRPGRFDRRFHIDLPDEPARRSILEKLLSGRPLGTVDLDDLARRTEGLTPATIANVVESASIKAFRASTQTGNIVHIESKHLIDALADRGGKDRPSIGIATWEELILAEVTKDELRKITQLITQPELAEEYGVEPVSGILLTGPPGTGKTTIAKIIAAQTHCSFYPVSPGDLTSMWLGESERKISDVFDRARENRPSVIFIDEIDAIAGTRGEYGTYDRQVNQLLQEIDGLGSGKGVTVIAATNRPDKIDPALLRGGRLSRQIEIPLPKQKDRERLFELFTKDMPVSDIDIPALAKTCDGLAGADLEAICESAAVSAMIDQTNRGGRAVVKQADFAKAITDKRQSQARASA